MGRKRRATSPAPPPPPPQESSTESSSYTEEEETPHAAAAPKPPQNSQPQLSAAAADDSDSSEEESDSDADEDAHAFQVRPVSRSPVKPAAPRPDSDADEEEEEDGESSESEPEVREPVQMKAAATKKSKAAEQGDKKRPAPEPAASGREKKAKKPGGKLEESGLDSPPPPSKSERSRHRRAWTNEDLVRILEAIAAHVKTEGALPKTDVLHAAVRDRIERKDTSRDELYRKIQFLKKQYEKTVATGTAPIGKDTVRMYNLSEEIWGEKAKEAIAAAAASKNGSSVTKGKKGQAQKEEMDGNSKVGTPKEVANQNGDTWKGSKKAKKSKKQGNTNEELGKDAKSGTTKESAATATQNGDALTNLERGTVNKDKMDIDPIPKEPSTGNENAGTLTEKETPQGETEVGACVQHTHRSFDELQNLYPSLAGCVQMIEAQHPYGESLKRAFELIDDEKADALESKIEALDLLAVQEEINRDNLKKEVVKMLIDLKD